MPTSLHMQFPQFPANQGFATDRPGLARNHTMRDQSSGQHRTSFAGNVSTNNARHSHAGGSIHGVSTGGGGGSMFAIERTLALLNHKVDALSTRMQLNLSGGGGHQNNSGGGAGNGGGNNGGGNSWSQMPPVRVSPGFGRSSSSRAGGVGTTFTLNGLIGTVKGGGAMTSRTGVGGRQQATQSVQFGGGHSNDGGGGGPAEDGRRVYVGSDPVASAAALLRRAQSAGVRNPRGRVVIADSNDGEGRELGPSTLISDRHNKSMALAGEGGGDDEDDSDEDGSDRELTEDDSEDERASQDPVHPIHQAAWGERSSAAEARGRARADAPRMLSPVPQIPSSTLRNLRNPAMQRAGLNETADLHNSGDGSGGHTHRRIDSHRRSSDQSRQLAPQAAHQEQYKVVSHYAPLRSQHSVGFPDYPDPSSPRERVSHHHFSGSNVSSRRTSNTSTHRNSNMGGGQLAHNTLSAAGIAMPTVVLGRQHRESRDSPSLGTTEPQSPKSTRLRAMLPVETTIPTVPDPQAAAPVVPSPLTVKTKSVGSGVVLGGGELQSQLERMSPAPTRGMLSGSPLPAEGSDVGSERTLPSAKARSVGFGSVLVERENVTAPPRRALGGAMRGSRRALLEPKGLAVAAAENDPEGESAAPRVMSPEDLSIGTPQVASSVVPPVALVSNSLSSISQNLSPVTHPTTAAGPPAASPRLTRLEPQLSDDAPDESPVTLPGQANQ